ncbi:unnamed protein product, partial [marine sediment metagenome]
QYGGIKVLEELGDSQIAILLAILRARRTREAPPPEEKPEEEIIPEDLPF